MSTPFSPDSSNDSQLLRAEEACVAFDPTREAFVQAQLEWAHASEYPLAVRLVTGASGSGKTRMALALCERLEAQGWSVGFMQSSCDIPQAQAMGRQIWQAVGPCCIVVDDAQAHQPTVLALLQTVLANREASRGQVAVRVLLLARDAGAWWGLLADQDAACQTLLRSPACSGPVPLPMLHASAAERIKAYHLALHTFAERLNTAAIASDPQTALDEALFGNPLHIQMAALLALRGVKTPPAQALADALVTQLRQNWGEESTLLTALATLSGGIASDRDIEPIWRALDGDKAQLKTLFRRLTAMSPGQHGLQRLRPKLMGDALVAQTLQGDQGARVLDALLARGDAHMHHNSLAVVARVLAQHPALNTLLEDALSRHWVACAEALVAVCIEESPSPLPQCAERAFLRLPKQQRWQLAGSLANKIGFDVAPLLGLKTLLCQEALNKARQKLNPSKPESMADCASALQHHSLALHYNGAHAAALDAAQEAAAMGQQLAQINPERFEPDWAASLFSYANRLAEQGMTGEAEAAAQQSFAVYQRLVQSKPGRYEEALEGVRGACALWQEASNHTE
jgi:hypothetical protein